MPKITATITTDGKKMIYARYEGGYGKAIAQRVPGARARWDKSVEPNQFLDWTYPLSMDTCRAFRRVYGQNLIVLPELSHWAREAIIREQTLEDFREGDLSGVDLGRVADEAPRLRAAMMNRSYQPAGAGFLITAGTGILADDPGLGKTLQALAAIIQSDSRVILVGCRKSAMVTVWERETARWAPTIKTFVAQGSRAEREKVFREFFDAAFNRVSKPGERFMLIVNIEMVRAKREEYCPAAKGECVFGGGAKPDGHPQHQYRAHPDWPFLFGLDWDAIVFDESHNLLASTANIQSKRITQWRFGAMKLRLREGGLKIACSGTPFRSNLTKIWGTLNWLRPKDPAFSSYWRWAETFFEVTSNGYSRNVGTYDAASDRYVPVPLDQAAWDRMLRPWMLRRTKAEVARDLPPIAYAGTPIDPEDPDSPCYVQLEMGPAQVRLYRQMEDAAEVTLDGRKITATGVLAEIARKRQFATAAGKRGTGRTILPALPSNKIEWIRDFLREREDTGQKVVIASSFTEVVELIARTLREDGHEVLTLTGATRDRDRADLVARFQDPNDSLQVVCLNRMAGGESITLDAADEMIVVDPPWVSDQDEQLEARIHRVSRIHQVTVYRLISSGTIEEWIAGLTDEQRAVLATASPRKMSEILKEALNETAKP